MLLRVFWLHGCLLLLQGCFLLELASDQQVSLQFFEELLSVLECGHRNRMGDTLCRHLIWPRRSISVSESFKYSSAIALPRREALSKQGDRHLASLCNDHTAYLCDNQKLNRHREQASESTFRWLSHCCCALFDLYGLHTCVFSLSVFIQIILVQTRFIWNVLHKDKAFYLWCLNTPSPEQIVKGLRDISMGAINSLYSTVTHQIHK